MMRRLLAVLDIEIAEMDRWELCLTLHMFHRIWSIRVA